ncbi:MAG: pantoate--beta-alanine ligase [Eubacteriales bacterium]
MQTLQTIKQTRECIKTWKKQGNTIGFVPTMGYLHEGHKSLIDRAREENDKVVVSIFLNPTQFGANEDLSTYPVDLEADSRLCEESGVDLIFHPQPIEMYPKDFCTTVNMTRLTEELCGKSRPVHFGGVCLVVNKLFNIVNADRAYFGEKDAQQLAVIKKMVQDLDMDIEVIGCPIIRERDGLAKSSRNVYLNEEERKVACILHETLQMAKEMLKDTKIQDVIKFIEENISSKPFTRIDYVQIVDSLTMQPVTEKKQSVLVAIAVFIGTTRLIDNFTLEV